jgi:hypothetical protein
MTNINNISIILTATVNVQNKSFLFQTDKQERIDTYLKSIKQWLEKTSFNIVLVENNGYTFPELEEYKSNYSDRFEVLTFLESEEVEAEYLKDNASKGLSEIFAINYAYYNSKFVKTSTFIIKVTCRFFIPEFEEYLSEYDLNTYDALSQNNIKQCQVVGSHIDNFHKIFNIYPFCRDIIWIIGHVEDVFRYRIHTFFKKVLICKPFTIEPTQCGGCDIIATII